MHLYYLLLLYNYLGLYFNVVLNSCVGSFAFGLKNFTW